MESALCMAPPATILTTGMCLSALSKNALRSTLELLTSTVEGCATPSCRTLKTTHTLTLTLASHAPCDSTLGGLLSGTFVVETLVTAFEGGDGTGRGFHLGDFVWTDGGLVAEGGIWGMTNIGTHREPVFDSCERCAMPGFMEGRFCGLVTSSMTGDLMGCTVTGTYYIGFDASPEGGAGILMATLEGVIMCPCEE